MKTKLHKTIFLTFGLLGWLPAAYRAAAVPALQIYTPSGEYVESHESWYYSGSKGVLRVVGASKEGNITGFESLELYFGVPEKWWNYFAEDAVTKSITITGPGHEAGTTEILFNDKDKDEAPELPDGSTMPPHGVYPAYWVTFTLPDMDNLTGETVYDYQPGETGTDTGKIYSYEVDIRGVYGAWADAAGMALRKNEDKKLEVAPFSHNGLVHAPEPGTYALGVIGCLALVAVLGTYRRFSYSR